MFRVRTNPRNLKLISRLRDCKIYSPRKILTMSSTKLIWRKRGLRGKKLRRKPKLLGTTRSTPTTTKKLLGLLNTKTGSFLRFPREGAAAALTKALLWFPVRLSDGGCLTTPLATATTESVCVKELSSIPAICEDKKTDIVSKKMIIIQVET
jgi:hypothetical protein